MPRSITAVTWLRRRSYHGGAERLTEFGVHGDLGEKGADYGPVGGFGQRGDGVGDEFEECCLGVVGMWNATVWAARSSSGASASSSLEDQRR